MKAQRGPQCHQGGSHPYGAAEEDNPPHIRPHGHRRGDWVMPEEGEGQAECGEERCRDGCTPLEPARYPPRVLAPLRRPSMGNPPVCPECVEAGGHEDKEG